MLHSSAIQTLSRGPRPVGPRAHAQRVALQAREMVQALQRELFGQDEPPFPDNAVQAAQWIEEQAQKQEFKTQPFCIVARAPAPNSYLGCAIWLADYLTQKLNRFTPGDCLDDFASFSQLMAECPAIVSLSGERTTLAYLGVNSEGEIGIKRVYTHHGTALDRLRSCAEELAQATNWQPLSAVHFLLTGGLLVPSSIQASPSYRVGTQYFGDNHQLAMTTTYPDSVTAKDLAAFQKARSDYAPPWRKRRVQRARISSKSERVAAFVSDTPKMSWLDRQNEWSRRNPNDRFRSVDAMKKAYSRANRHFSSR